MHIIGIIIKQSLFHYFRIVLNIFVLLQPSVRFQDLRKTTEHTTAWGETLLGLCSDGSKLYTVERRMEDSSYRLCLYHIGAKEFKLLDSVEVKVVFYCRPHVSDQNHRIYLPCGDEGVWIFRTVNNRLVTVKKLRCVTNVKSVTTGPLDTVIVCAKRVSMLNVTGDTILLHFQEARRSVEPRHLAMLWDRILVCYGFNTLVLYNPLGIPVEEVPLFVRHVYSISTDNSHSRFLVTHSNVGDEKGENDSVVVLDDKGHNRHVIDTGKNGIRDCTVVQSQLWLGYYFRSIDVMSDR